ncbi:type IV secretion system protein [Rhizobium leguminosarum]|nr:type IV secretion system protein [Rhizobium leguminosarum]
MPFNQHRTLSSHRPINAGANMPEQTTQHAFEDELFFNLREQRNNWAKIAGLAATSTVLSLVALIIILPFKEIKPYVVMVDKATGEAENIVQVRPASLKLQEALLRAELFRYVSERETYDPADNSTRIRDVMDRSSDDAAETLTQTWRPGSAQYPPEIYGDHIRVRVVIRSVSPIPSEGRNKGDLAQVRFTKVREEKGRDAVRLNFIATVRYQFKPQVKATLKSVWKNPLGFSVLSYRIDGETPELEGQRNNGDHSE